MSTPKEREIEELPEDLPPEEIEPAEANPQPKPQARAEEPKAKKPKAKSGKEAREDEEKDARAAARSRREADPNARKVPYPPSPEEVPEGLTDYAESYVKQQNLLLAGLFVFLMFYIGAVLFFALIGAWCIWSLGHLFLLKVIGLVFSSFFFLYLVKGFFKSHPMDKEMHLEITENEHPVLFKFIEQLCDELGAPLPNKVFVSPDVNAAVMPRTSLINLFVEPKKDLLIGLGLVNSCNLSEFKAVLAHEFGHFSQSAMASSYTYVASRIIGDLVEGEDWFDRMISWCKKQENVFAVFGHVVGAPLWVMRKILEQCYKIITLQRLAVSREREFHADLVAVSAAGSNAVVHCLLRTDFGHQCFIQALNDLSTAVDHKLYSNDLYLHQDRASAVVRRKKKEPELGMPPAFKSPHEGKNTEVFDAEEEEMTDEIPPMWRTHPSNSDREKNAKEQFVPAVVDHRSPWVLFDTPAELRERMTYKFYRMHSAFRIPKNTDLADAAKVQKFIDNEHADTTYDPKYKGAYDDRPLEPGDLAELNTILRDKPWDDERMEKVLTKLYDGCEEHAEAHSELYKEVQALRGSIVGRPSSKLKRQIEDVEKKQDENWEWFKSFDRRVYLLHVQMASQVAKDEKEELIERYRFQLEVQRLYQESRNAFNEADKYLTAHAMNQRGEINLGPEFVGEVLRVLRESWKALKKIIKDAREINLPAMKNFEEGESLVDFILEGKMVPEPPLNYAKGAWINKLMTQLQGVRLKCFRLHFKSVGGILRIQEQIAVKWKVAREPIGAEVVEVEPIAAEVIPAEVIEAEAIPVEVIEAEVIPEEVAVPAAPPETPKAMAAFVATAAPSAVHELHSPPPSPAPISLDLAAPAPVEPAPRANVFDFDTAAPAPVAVPTPTSFPAPESVTEAVAEMPSPAEAPFSLDAVPASKPEPAKPSPVTSPGAAEDIFSLDADTPVNKSAPQPAAPAEIELTNQTLWLDPAKLKAEKAAREAAEKKAAEAKPQPSAALASTPTGSAVVGPSAPRVVPPVAKSDPVAITKPASGNRPTIRITMVKPGEKSPLTK